MDHLNRPALKKWLEAERDAQAAIIAAITAAEEAYKEFKHSGLGGPGKLPGVFRDENNNIALGYTEHSKRWKVKHASGKSPLTSSQTAAFMACERPQDGKNLTPWRNKQLQRPKPESEIPELEFAVAHNPREEAELLAAGWQLVKSE